VELQDPSATKREQNLFRLFQDTATAALPQDSRNLSSGLIPRKAAPLPMTNSTRSWDELSVNAKVRLLRMHYESGVGHIGGNLSCLDLLLTLHHRVLGQMDQFVLSKGHAAGAYYVTLWTLGKLTDQDLNSFHRDGTRLSGHPPSSGIESILFATGSLGHGFSLAAGLALAKRLRGEPGRVFCLTSDGEWNEGSCWEALIFVRHHRIDNLTLVVDVNGLQGFGTTREVADLEPLAAKFRAFGLPTEEVNGHNADELEHALNRQNAGMQVVIARTHKGRGISFMEDQMEWHYLPMTEVQYRQAIQEIEGACAAFSASP
jgi:transketolase